MKYNLHEKSLFIFKNGTGLSPVVKTHFFLALKLFYNLFYGFFYILSFLMVNCVILESKLSITPANFLAQTPNYLRYN